MSSIGGVVVASCLAVCCVVMNGGEVGSDIIAVGTVLEARLSGIAMEGLTAGNVVIGICVKDRGGTAVGGSDGDDEVSTLDTEAGTGAVDAMVAGTELVVREDASEELVDGSSNKVRGWEVAVAA